MDQDPITGLKVLVIEEPDVDGPAYAADIDTGQVRLIGQDVQDLAWNTETHGSSSARRRRAL